MKQYVKFLMNTIAKPETINEFLNLVTDDDYCTLCVERGSNEGTYTIFELKIKEIFNSGNEYVQKLYTESDNGFDIEQFAEDYITGKKEAVELFEDDENWNIEEITLNDNGNDKEQLIDLLSCMYLKDEAEDMIDNHIETARIYAARELYWQKNGY